MSELGREVERGVQRDPDGRLEEHGQAAQGARGVDALLLPELGHLLLLALGSSLYFSRIFCCLGAIACICLLKRCRRIWLHLVIGCSVVRTMSTSMTIEIAQSPVSEWAKRRTAIRM
jgi:hypothetical protein